MDKKQPIRKVRSVPIRQLSNKSNDGKKVVERRDTEKTLTKILFEDVDHKTFDLIEKRSELTTMRARRFGH